MTPRGNAWDDSFEPRKPKPFGEVYLSMFCWTTENPGPVFLGLGSRPTIREIRISRTSQARINRVSPRSVATN